MNEDPKPSPKKPRFLTGVVEGFYGRPWTTEQRKDLFAKLQSWGMTSYLYAPKDDVKHRAYWREMYTVEEAEHLQSLVQLAKECNIDFYYAISPGLDITYSSPKELGSLKRKLDQVSQLGCECFALLFDDIEPEMCKQDKEVFQSFAQAQVTVTNDIYEHLNNPKFLFCPTQYCTARAVPSIRNSEYLNTIGGKLAPEIDIMWTGDKVITKTITPQSLEDINDVLKRPVVIWDNEHANDYDQKRVFLGPYSGRSPELIQKLNGVLTNPNCEYGANFVAIHTLAQWSKCTIDGLAPYSNASETVTADIKLEIQATTDSLSSIDAHDSNSSDNVSPLPVGELPHSVYHPRNALFKAIRDWIPEFSKQKTVWGPMSKPQVGLAAPTLVPIVSQAPMPPVVGNPAESSEQPAQPAHAQVQAQAQQPEELPQAADIEDAPMQPMVEEPVGAAAAPTAPAANITSLLPLTLATSVDSALAPVSLPVMNSLVSTNKVIVDQNVLSNTAPTLPDGNTINVPLGVNPIVAVANPVLGQQMPVHPPLGEDGDSPMTPVAPTPPVLPVVADKAEPLPAMTEVVTAVPQTQVVIVTHQLPTAVTEQLPSGVLPIVGEEATTGTDILPGPTYLEPMETAPAVLLQHKVSSTDIVMDSMTSPNTPMMQENTSPGIKKAESTTMLCEETVAKVESAVAASANGQSGLLGQAGSSAPEEYLLSNNPEVTTMLCDDQICTDSKEVDNLSMNAKDLLLLSQLFYLPSEHGQISHDLLNDFFWLKRNASVMLPPGSPHASTAEDRLEWERLAAKFKHNVTEIQTLFIKLCSVQNRELVYDLYMYLWDMCGVVQTLEGFVQWMSKGCLSPKSQNYIVGQQTWFSGIREAFSSGDHEPWMFRGGLASDLQRLLPLDSGNDLYIYKFPEVPANVLYYVRPFQPKDWNAIYSLAADAYEKTIDAPLGLCGADRQLVGDRTVGAYLTLCPEYAFVCENSLDGSIVGYAVAAPDAKIFYQRYISAWLPEMRLKYPLKKSLLTAASTPSMEEDDGTDVTLTPLPGTTPIEQMALSFHMVSAEPVMPAPLVSFDAATAAANGSVAAAVLPAPWGVASFRVNAPVATADSSLPKRMVMLLLACLRASGTVRIFVENLIAEQKQKEFYQLMGFGQVAPSANEASNPNPASSESLICMTRSF